MKSGERLAYIDFGPAYNGLYGGTAGWRGYRGGTTPSIRVLDPQAATWQPFPVTGSMTSSRSGLATQVYFLSDRHDKSLQPVPLRPGK
jgi:tricorn protease